MTKKAWAFENSAKFCFYSRERERERERERDSHTKRRGREWVEEDW